MYLYKRCMYIFKIKRLTKTSLLIDVCIEIKIVQKKCLRLAAFRLNTAHLSHPITLLFTSSSTHPQPC